MVPETFTKSDIDLYLIFDKWAYTVEILLEFVMVLFKIEPLSSWIVMDFFFLVNHRFSCHKSLTSCFSVIEVKIWNENGARLKLKV